MRRREFLASLGAAIGAGVVSRADDAGPIRAALFLPSAHPAKESARAGAELGAGEASRVATLMGRSFHLTTTTVRTADEAIDEASELPADRILLGGIDGSFVDALGRTFADRFLAIRAREDAVPDTGEERYLSASPSYADYAQALAGGLLRTGLERIAFRKQDAVLSRAASAVGLREAPAGEADVVVSDEPEDGVLSAGVALPRGPGTVCPVSWHASLSRYGAGELNERFAGSTGRPMDDVAWSVWIAIKLVVESSLRGTGLREARTDGHKGVPLVFEGGRLRQPLYVVLTRDGNTEVIDA